MPSYKPGPLPPTAAADCFAIMKKVGIRSMSMKDLRLRLEDKYKVDLFAQKDAIAAVVDKVLTHPDFKKALAAPPLTAPIIDSPRDDSI